MSKYAKKKCETCGKTYSPGSGSQRWCLKCRDAAYAEKNRDPRRWSKRASRAHGFLPKVCAGCGAEYTPTSSTQKRCKGCSVWLNKPAQSPAKDPVYKMTRYLKDTAKGWGMDRPSRIPATDVELDCDEAGVCYGKAIAKGWVDGEECVLVQLNITRACVPVPAAGVAVLRLGE